MGNQLQRLAAGAHSGAGRSRIFLVRHGETAWSLSGQHTSRSELAVTAHGEEQARALGALLAGITFSHRFTSPRLRARQTCEAIGWPPADIGIDDDLAEWDYGAYEGRRTVEIHMERPDWNLFFDGCPDGESPSAVSGRADRVVARLRALEGNVAICSHGHFGRVIGARWIGRPITDAQHLLLDTASISVLDYEHHSHVPAIAVWNLCA